VTSLVVLAFLIPLGLVVAQLARERALADAERQTAVVVAVLTVTTDPSAVDRALIAAGGRSAGRVGVRNLGGGDVGERHAKPDDITRASGQQRSAVVEVPGGLSYLEPVDVGAIKPAVVEVFIPQDELRRGVMTAWYALAALGIGLVIVSMVVGDRLGAKVVGSARQLAAATAALGEGELEVRVKPSGPRELMEAGIAFNVMADRIVALLANERELVADLSHRLRTPLTALRLDAETLDEGRSADRIRSAIASLEAEVDKLIRVARKQTTVLEVAEPQRCDLAEVVRDRMVFWSAIAGDQNRACKTVGVAQPVPVTVPRSELAAALDALLGNVIRYTPQGVPFEVAVSRRKDGYVALRVDDGGPGIPDPERALQRGASNQGSTGLGLDIVKRVAEAGRGAVNIGQSRLGGASVVILMSDAEPQRPPPNASRFGLVGRLSREPAEQRGNSST
jgi:signal transduction histidine kinase